MSARSIALLLLSLAPACRVGAPYVRVQVISESSAAITQLEVTSTLNGQSATFGVPNDPTGTPISFPNSFTVELPSGAQGQLEIAVSARDGGGLEVATATGVAPVNGNQVYDLTVVLRGGGDGGTPDFAGVDLPPPDLAQPPAPDLLNLAWVQQSPPMNTNKTLLLLWSSGPDDVYVIGYAGTILHTVDHGKTWLAQASPSGEDLIGMWGSSANDVYIVGLNNTILHSTGNGTWSAESSPSTAGKNLYTIWGTGPNDIWLAGATGVLLHSSGNGTWDAQTYKPGNQVWSIWSSGPTILMCGDGPAIYRSTDSGMSFGTVNVPAGPTQLSQLWGSSLNDVYIAGDAGSVLHSTDSGQTFGKLGSLPGSVSATHLWCVWGSGANDVWVSGDAATILHSDGMTWAKVSNPGVMTNNLYSIWGTGPGDVYAAGYGPFLAHLQ